jgi:uncharacterized protein (DUF1778 family)
MPTIKTRKNKEVRFNVRATVSQKQLIARAAEKEDRNFSDFVLENALSAAEAIVGDDANFTLDKTSWNAFCAALDAPPRKIPALRKLLTEQSVFDAK